MNARSEFQRTEGRVETLRVPPQSVDAEQAVLGGVMLAPESIWRVLDLIDEKDFYRRDHRLIFRAMRELGAPKAPKTPQPIDAVTLGEWFDANGLAEQIGGTAYLIELANSTPSAANIRAYAEIVRDKSQFRQLIEAGTAIVNDGFSPEGRSVLEVLAGAQSRLGHVLRNEPSELESPGPILDRLMEEMAATHDSGTFDGVSTGFPDLDRELCGLKGGQLVIVAGRPKMGKTTLARNIAEHVALELDYGVAFHSLEMPEKQQMQASCCSLGSVDHGRVRSRSMDELDWKLFIQASGRLRNAPLLMSRPRSTRVQQLAAQTRRAHAEALSRGERPLKLVVIDYLQLIDVGAGENRAQAYGDVTRTLKLLAVDLDIVVVLLSQLNRKLEERPDKRPIPSDLRDSGAIEQDADVVLFVYRDEEYHKGSRWAGTAEIIVGLQRSGSKATVRVLSELHFCRFRSLPAGWEPDVPARHSDDDREPRPRKSRFRTRAEHQAAADRVRDVTGGDR